MPRLLSTKGKQGHQRKCLWLGFLVFYLFALLGMEPRASNLLAKGSVTEYTPACH